MVGGEGRATWCGVRNPEMSWKRMSKTYIVTLGKPTKLLIELEIAPVS